MGKSIVGGKKRLFFLIALILTSVLTLLIYFSWGEVVSASNAPRAFNKYSIDVSSILNVFDSTLRTEREQLTIDNFFINKEVDFRNVIFFIGFY